MFSVMHNACLNFSVLVKNNVEIEKCLHNAFSTILENRF